jgi:hypothetical protein
MLKSRRYGPGLPPLTMTSTNAESDILNIPRRGQECVGCSALSGIGSSAVSMNLPSLGSALGGDRSGLSLRPCSALSKALIRSRSESSREDAPSVDSIVSAPNPSPPVHADPFALFDAGRNDWALGAFLISRGFSSKMEPNDADGSRLDLLDDGNA